MNPKQSAPLVLALFLLVGLAACGLQYVPAGDNPAIITVNADGKLDMQHYESVRRQTRSEDPFVIEITPPFWRLKVQIHAADGTFRELKPAGGMAVGRVNNVYSVAGQGQFYAPPGQYTIRVILYCHIIKRATDGWTNDEEYVRVYQSWKILPVDLAPGGSLNIDLPDGSMGS